MNIPTQLPSDRECRAKLAQIATECPMSIRAAIAVTANQKTYAHVGNFFQDLCHHGCVSGMIPDLVSYADTHRFFDAHYGEIDELRQEFEDSTGEPLKINGDLKNALAWFAFEQIAFQLAGDLELDL